MFCDETGHGEEKSDDELKEIIFYRSHSHVKEEASKLMSTCFWLINYKFI